MRAVVNDQTLTNEKTGEELSIKHLDKYSEVFGGKVEIKRGPKPKIDSHWFNKTAWIQNQTKEEPELKVTISKWQL